jgi:pimeloyl-ACP methyl ester carboxylesterase
VISRFTPWHRGGEGPPLVLLHGFTDTWRTWTPVLPALERRHDVLAVTLGGHAGGPPLPDAGPDAVVDLIERAMDEAGFAVADVAGNSLGGYAALRLAERGRARSVVALAPAGGWAPGDRSFEDALAQFEAMQELLPAVAPQAELLLSTPEGRRRATAHFTERAEHLPVELLAHVIRGAAACSATTDMIATARRDGWPLEPERILCPVRVVWGTADRILPWPRAAEGYRRLWLPQADWVVLDGVGHCPQLDVPLETAELILGWTAG